MGSVEAVRIKHTHTTLVPFDNMSEGTVVRAEVIFLEAISISDILTPFKNTITLS